MTQSCVSERAGKKLNSAASKLVSCTPSSELIGRVCLQVCEGRQRRCTTSYYDQRYNTVWTWLGHHVCFRCGDWKGVFPLLGIEPLQEVGWLFPYPVLSLSLNTLERMNQGTAKLAAVATVY